MKRRKIIYNLLIINLILSAIFIFIKIPILITFFSKLVKVVLMPIVIGTFFFYLIKPLNDVFLKKKMKPGRAATLTLLIASILLCSISMLLGKYLVREFRNLLIKAIYVIQNDGFIKELKEYAIRYFNFNWIYDRIINYIQSYIHMFSRNGLKIFSHAMNLFSSLLLVIVIIFYLLKDGLKFKKSVLKFAPDRYKDQVSRIMSESNEALSSYVTGQACVALSLAIMIYMGYLVIKMPSAILFASMTFILAFIPFLGFFISMIIPYIIALSYGWLMVVKLTLLFMIAQAVKGRVVVPFIMSKAMHIHPLTDIFLVVAAASLIGPLGAFIIVPVYSVLKIIWVNMKIFTTTSEILYKNDR